MKPMKTETHRIQLPGLAFNKVVELHDDRIIIRVSFDDDCEWDDQTLLSFVNYSDRIDQWADEIAAPYRDDTRPVSIYLLNPIDNKWEITGRRR